MSHRERHTTFTLNFDVETVYTLEKKNVRCCRGIKKELGVDFGEKSK